MKTFEKTIDLSYLNELANFIHYPSQNMSDKKKLNENVNLLKFILDKNPERVMTLMIEDFDPNFPNSSVSFLLDDLVDKIKMNKKNQGINIEESADIEELKPLYENAKCLNQLLDCIYNIFDLSRCIKPMKSYKEEIMKRVLSNSEIVKRILKSRNNQEDILKDIHQFFPADKQKFEEAFQTLNIVNKI